MLFALAEEEEASLRPREQRIQKKFVFNNHNIIVITVFESKNQAHGLMFVFIKQRIRHLLSYISTKKKMPYFIYFLIFLF